MAPPSSSGTTIGEALNILSGYDLGAEPRATALFQYLEASRLAYADRDRYVGDPRFANVPLSEAAQPGVRRDPALPDRRPALTSPLAPGNPFAPFAGCGRRADAARQATSASPEAHHTNNIVTTDRWGDIVAYTNTINFFGGSGETVPGYGFLLNDELTDFDFAPPSSGAPDPNLPAAAASSRARAWAR